MSVEVKQVKTKKDLKNFIDFPWFVYKNDPNWVPPLKTEVANMINKDKYAFWEHADRELFLAYKDGKIVGRIAAIVDENHNKFHNDNIGFFGFFESQNDSEVSNALFDAAKDWLKQQGRDTMRGPMNPSMNDECALLIEGFDSPPAIMMTYNPKYYVDLVNQYGFTKAKGLVAFYKDSSKGIPDRVKRLMEHVRQKTGVEVRSLDMKNFYRDVEIIKDVYNKSWEKNWGFVPMTNKEMDALAEALKPIAEPELVKFAFVKGKAVGVSIVLPNLNELLIKFNGKMNLINIIRFLTGRKKIKGTRAIVFGFVEGYRQTGLPLVLYYETEVSGLKLGYEWVELSWNLEDNDLINKFDTMLGGHIYKRYNIYDYKID